LRAHVRKLSVSNFILMNPSGVRMKCRREAAELSRVGLLW
jgi:hypothetical protein